MKIKLLDRPKDPGPRQDAWDAAELALTEIAWTQHRGSRRKVRGSRRSRKLFFERVVLRAIQSQSNDAAKAHATRQAVGEILEVALADWREEAIYSTVTFGDDQ